MYTIDTDPAANVIRVRLAGMLSVEETTSYIAELRDRFRRDRMRPGYRLLIDVDQCTIQSQEMIAAMRDQMAGFPKASRIAIVTGSSLARIQAKRLMTQPYASVFATQDEANRWLHTDPASDASEPAGTPR